MLRLVTSPSVVSLSFAHSYCAFISSSFVYSNLSSQSLCLVFTNLLIPSITFAALSSSLQDGSLSYTIVYSAYPIVPHLSVWCNLMYPSELVSAPCSATSLAVVHSFSLQCISPVLLLFLHCALHRSALIKHINVVISFVHHSLSKRSSLRNHLLTPRVNRPLCYHSNNTLHLTISPLLHLSHCYLCPQS